MDKILISKEGHYDLINEELESVRELTVKKHRMCINSPQDIIVLPVDNGWMTALTRSNGEHFTTMDTKFISTAELEDYRLRRDTKTSLNLDELNIKIIIHKDVNGYYIESDGKQMSMSLAIIYLITNEYYNFISPDKHTKRMLTSANFELVDKTGASGNYIEVRYPVQKDDHIGLGSYTVDEVHEALDYIENQPIDLDKFPTLRMLIKVVRNRPHSVGLARELNDLSLCESRLRLEEAPGGYVLHFNKLKMPLGKDQVDLILANLNNQAWTDAPYYKDMEHVVRVHNDSLDK